MLLLVTAALFVLTSCAMAPQISPAARSELTSTGKLRVGINYGNFLLVTSGPNATEPRGPAPDLARELGRRLGVPVEFVQFDTAGKLADGVKTGMWDVAFLGAEPSRANEIAFTAAYLEIPSTYLVPAGSPIRSIADVDRAGVRIAVSERSAYELYLTRTIKHAKLVYAKGIDGSYEVFVSQKLEALAGLKPRLLTDVQKLPGARGARRPVHRGSAGDRHAQEPRRRRRVPPPVRRGREGVGLRGGGDREERRRGRLRARAQRQASPQLA